MSLSERRTVVSKDGDFYNTFTASREPFKLLHVKIGNSKNAELVRLFEKNLDAIVSQLDSGSVVELTRTYIITVR